MRIDSLLTFKFQFPGSSSERGGVNNLFPEESESEAASTGAREQCNAGNVGGDTGKHYPVLGNPTFILYSVVSVIRVTITRDISDILATQSATDSRLGSGRRVNTSS